MANLIGRINSDDGRTQASKLAHRNINVSAATWKIEVSVSLIPNGNYTVMKKDLNTGKSEIIACLLQEEDD